MTPRTRNVIVVMTSGLTFRGHLYPSEYQDPFAWVRAPRVFDSNKIFVQMSDGSRSVLSNQLANAHDLTSLVPNEILVHSRNNSVSIAQLTPFNSDIPHLPNQSYVAMPDGRVFAGVLQHPR